MSIQYNLKGRVQLIGMAAALPDLRIEFYDESGNEGWIGGARTNAAGEYSLLVNDPAASALRERRMLLKAVLYRGDRLVYERVFEDPAEAGRIEIPAERYDTAVVDATHKGSEADGYFTVCGSVRTASGLAVNGGVVNVYEQGFREQKDELPVASARTDADGRYEVKIALRQLALPPQSATPVLRVKVGNDGAGAVASSADFLADSSQIVVDVTVPDGAMQAQAAYDSILATAVAASGLSPDAIAGIRSDEKDNELRRLALVSGRTEEELEVLVQAHKEGAALGIQPSIIYALSRGGVDIGEGGLLHLKEHAVRDALQEAIGQGVIQHPGEAEIAAAIGRLKEAQLGAAREWVIPSEGIALGTALDAAFGGAEATTDYLTRLRDFDGDDMGAFWDQYARDAGPEAAQRLQRGLQLLALTGFQEQMTARLSGNYAGDMFALARLNDAEWTGEVNAASGRDGVAVPKAILEAHEGDVEAAKVEYTAKLKEISQAAFPLAAIARKLEENNGEEVLIEDEEQRTRAAAFLNTNPGFDFRIQTVHDITDEQVAASIPRGEDIPAAREALIATLAPFQRLVRIAGGKPDAIAAMKHDGLDSAQAITEVSEENFKAAYSAKFGSAQAATAAYAQAQKVAAVATQTATSYFASADKTSNISVFGGQAAGPMASPELRTMFGSQETCGCEHCLSVYSPSAYFVDILAFLRKNSGNPSAYAELIRRRPDLPYIDLTCKNANTPLPYVDLVLELLEGLAVKSIQPANVNNPFIPASYQTGGNAADLAAYPEHVYRHTSGEYRDNPDFTAAYDQVLKSAVYPTNLPFNLALEEARTYGKHLGYSRYALMKTFRPVTLASNVNTANQTSADITEYNLMNESLGISKEAADIITGKYNGPATWAYYGFKGATITPLHAFVSPADSSVYLTGPWATVLRGDATTNTSSAAFGGLDVLIQQLKISFKELTQLLGTDFLNPVAAFGDRQVKIVARAGSPADTCVLKDLRLQVTLLAGQTQGAFDEDFFSRLHRFVRLWRATGLGIYELDTLFQSLGVTAAAGLTLENYVNVARAITIARELGVVPTALAAWWAPLSTRRYADVDSSRADTLPSAYDRLYNNKSVLNPPDPAFADTVFTTPVPVPYDGHTAAILAATGLKEEDLLTLMGAMNISTTSVISLADLSRIQAAAVLTRSTGRSVGEIIRLNTLADFGLTAALPAAGSTASQYALRLAKLEKLLQTSDDLAETRLSLDEVEYALRDSNVGGLVPKDEAITQFYRQLISALQKAVTEGNADADTMRKIVREQLAAHFDMDASAVKYLVTDELKIEIAPGLLLAAQDALRSDYFIAHNPDSSTQPVPQLREFYRRMAKTAWWMKRMHVSAADLMLLLRTTLSALNVWAPFTLASDAAFAALTAEQRLDKLLRYAFWIVVRDTQAADNATWATVVEWSGKNSSSKADWVTAVQNATSWTPGTMKVLVGTATPLTPGILNTAFPADFRSPRLLLQMGQIVKTADRIGLTPGQLAATLDAGLTMTHARYLLKAAKAKHSDAQWLKTAKPLRDVLREKQRAALVAWTVANPAAGQKWRNENELYAYLLIDPEMSPCMMTSRTKQAIASVQLFMDRVILNLEFREGNPAWMISVTPPTIEQWKEWRKWYRIWEANRKVFLYPENWIEPELRDDKTPFFRELETTLLQDEVTTTKVEDAYLEYLEKLDSVARLEPVSSFHQVEKEDGIDILHVVARTHAQPHIYYYRKLENDEWTAWEKMNLEVKGEHVMAVVWNRRLHLFWLTFIEKGLTEEAAKRLPASPNGSTTPYWTKKFMGAPGFSAQADPKESEKKYWHVQLNWSQQKDGKWLAPSMSKDMMELVPAKVKITPQANSSYANVPGQVYEYLTKKGEKEQHEVFRDRLYMSPYFDSDGALVVSMMFPPGMNEYAIGMHGFRFADGSADPYVLRDSDRGTKMIAPHHTLINAMKFVESPVKASNGDNPLATNTPVWIPNRPYFIYPMGGLTSNGYSDPTHGAAQTILQKTQYGNYRITAKANLQDATFFALNDHFFFEDDRHTFFVRRRAHGNVVQEVPGVVTDVRTASFTAANNSVTLVYGNGNFSFDYPIAMPLDNAFSLNSSKYYFQTFQHPHIHAFMKRLRSGGIPKLLALGTQVKVDTMGFNANYQPTALVHPTHPTNAVDFAYDGAYSQYNWELFFHIPMLIAQRLSDNQQFEDAQKWYHYIFDPTSNADEAGNITGSKQRFWKFRPLNDEAGAPIVTLAQMMANINQYAAQVAAWERDPFKPHVIARLRRLAYMKNVVMKYLDNLIAWGDQLFARDTIESINEATLLYILAANILGPRPQEMSARAVAILRNFAELAPTTSSLDAFSNALVQIETFIGPNAMGAGASTTTSWLNSREGKRPEMPKMWAFCLPANDKLLRYWDTVADRLFKIRNCRNLEGAERSLPLYEPPIDPGLLVKAAAAGVSAASVLNDLAAGTVPYRFSYVVQKALELVGDVRSLSSELLSALEKRDAETMALLRSGHEMKLLDKMRAIKEGAIREAENALEVLHKTRQSTEHRVQYYNSRTYMNANEREHFDSVRKGMILQVIQGVMQTVASFLNVIPQIHVQAPFSLGPSFGGQHLGAAMQGVSNALGIKATIDSTKGNLASIKGGYDRRMDDWQFQAQSARKELEGIDKQILGAQIRIEMAKKELANHDVQVENTREADEYMRSKYTNVELYGWMVSQISTVYFQAYQMAYKLAKKAEQCFDYELPLAKPVAGFIAVGYWDSLRKGLLTAEKLQSDLRRMEIAYIEKSERTLELTKHVSLALTDPEALLDLRRDGRCDFTLSRMLFNLDFPGHYLRRVKSVSMSIPCVAGPYTTVGATLRMSGGDIRNQQNAPLTLSTAQMLAIATSSAQNDSGVFELNFRDERYLPFEGAGIEESGWSIDMMQDADLRQFDYSTITDVILHVKYTALDDGNSLLAAGRIADLKAALHAGTNGLPLDRYFSLKHEFPNEWHAYAQAVATGVSAPKLTLPFRREHFPFFCDGKTINLKTAYLEPRRKAGAPQNMDVRVSGTTQAMPLPATTPNNVGGSLAPTATAPVLVNVELFSSGTTTPLNPDAVLDDLYFVLSYTATV